MDKVAAVIEWQLLLAGATPAELTAKRAPSFIVSTFAKASIRAFIEIGAWRHPARI